MKKALLLVCLLALCNLTLAQTGKQLRSGRTERAAKRVAPKAVSSNLATIFSNLGPSPFDLYSDYYWFIDDDQFIGSAFTPAANAHVSQVQVPVLHFAGPKVIYVLIYSDSAGYPGALLEGPVAVTKIPEGGTCCGLAVADFLPLPVFAGQRYWVVVSTALGGPGAKFVGGWYWGYQGAVPPVAFDLGPKWFDEPSYQDSGVLVLGTWDPTMIGCQ